MSTNIGIYSVGMYLPDQIRKNDWWPQSVVDAWKERAEYKIIRSEKAPDQVDVSEGTRRALEGIKQWAADPFNGVKERRIAPENMLAVEMEIRAARDAITRSGIDPQEIGLVLGGSSIPDFVAAPSAGVVHHELGLNPRCITTDVGAICNSFAMQLTLASEMVKSGAVKYALLIQTSTMSRVCPIEDPVSAWFGDGSTAVVVGPVAADKGLLAYTHRTFGKYNRGLVVGTPNGKWYEEGRPVLYSDDRKIGREMILSIADIGAELVGEVLTKANTTADQVGFYASHQATPWLRPVTQAHIGLVNAKYVDTFPFTASLAGANATMQLAVGEREGLLRDGTLLATLTGGGGTTCTGMLVRWGR